MRRLCKMDFFIPKAYKKQQISIRIDQDMLDKIDELSEKNEISRSELINQCINYALNTMDNNLGFKNNSNIKTD